VTVTLSADPFVMQQPPIDPSTAATVLGAYPRNYLVEVDGLPAVCLHATAQTC
jgi:hypothetical protein